MFAQILAIVLAASVLMPVALTLVRVNSHVSVLNKRLEQVLKDK